MKIAIYISIVIILISWVSNNRNESDKLRTDLSSEAYDSTLQFLKSKTDSFLINPFDLYKFKKKKYGALSGGESFENYHYKPKQKGGIGYYFYMFEPRSANYSKNMRRSDVGYIYYGDRRLKRKVLNQLGLVIKTYQPNDKFKNKYLNPNEIMIELTAQYNDYDLHEMDFVGLDSLEIVKQFGKESFYKRNCMVYTKDNIALILNINNNRVDWFRYVLLAEKLEKDSEHEGLYNKNVW